MRSPKSSTRWRTWGAAIRASTTTYSSASMPRTWPTLYAIPGAEILVKEFENGPPMEAPIAIRIIGRLVTPVMYKLVPRRLNPEAGEGLFVPQLERLA